jgi:hypothetical protein
VRYILILFVLCALYFTGKSQTSNNKTIYLKVNEELTNKYQWEAETILIYDSIANWNAKENYSLLSLIKKRQKLKTTEWDSVLQNFDLCPQAEPINSYFNLHDIPKIAGVKFRYETQKTIGTDTYAYWRISFSPLYFNVDNAKCVAIAEFLFGKCSNGAKRIFYFQKNKDGAWVKAKRLFAE